MTSKRAEPETTTAACKQEHTRTCRGAWGFAATWSSYRTRSGHYQMKSESIKPKATARARAHV
eukprot:6208071-Pleurochrysis_carterae.AAC.1